LVGFYQTGRSLGEPAGGAQLDVGYAPWSGVIPVLSVFLGGGSETLVGSNYTHFYFNPAVGMLYYPSPKSAVSLGARIGFLDDKVSMKGLTIDASGFQVNSEFGSGFWIGSRVEVSFRAIVGYFSVRGSGSQSGGGGGMYSYSSGTYYRDGPYFGGLVALTLN
jgi:hypothetical protein